jgi:hypothetical protein
LKSAAIAERQSAVFEVGVRSLWEEIKVDGDFSERMGIPAEVKSFEPSRYVVRHRPVSWTRV